MKEKSLLKMLEDEKWVVFQINVLREILEEDLKNTDMLDNPYFKQSLDKNQAELTEKESQLYKIRNEMRNYFVEVLALTPIENK